MEAVRTETVALDPAVAHSLIVLIEQGTGIRVVDGQWDNLGRGVAHLLAARGFVSPEALLDVLTRDPCSPLVGELASWVTVPETHFFRVVPQIAALRETLLPRMMERLSEKRRVAVWSAGCSTGEEAYTLAILPRECRQDLSGWRRRILATDLNARLLEVARRACYGEWSFRDTPDDLRVRYFVRDGHAWRLREDLREDVDFVQHNLAEPLAAAQQESGGFDLILCRNVTIYFGSAAANRLYERLAELLAPDGCLLLGPCDPIPRPDQGLAPEFLQGSVLWRRRPVDPARPQTAPVFRSSRAPSTPSRPAHHRIPRPAVLPPGGAQPAGPKRPDAELAAGMAALEGGDVVGAAAALRRAAYLEPSNAMTQFALGGVLLRLGELGRARSALLHARRLLATKWVERDSDEDGGNNARDLRLAIDALLASCVTESRQDARRAKSPIRGGAP
jgi:chemotaxis protein methyltransferase CheR